MLRSVYATLLVLAVTARVHTQFFDFFTALQPVGHQTLRPIYHFDATPKRTGSQTKNSKHETTTRRHTTFSLNTDDLDKDKHKTKSSSHDPYTATIRKTTKSNSSRRHQDANANNREKSFNIYNSRSNSASNNVNKDNPSRPTTHDARNSGPKAHSPRAQLNANSNNDRLIFDDGSRNTVLNYETTRPNHQTVKPSNHGANKNKNTRTTLSPDIIRPGFHQSVDVNRPAITNRPPTQRPTQRPAGFAFQDDLTVSPELIIGPNEDRMTTVEKKQHIEIAEKMCDRYKSLDIKQVVAIPLLPAPDPVKVNVSTCSPSGLSLVVGGKVVTIEEFRHMALLGWNNLQYGGYSWKCGGSLVSNQYVLTAAHCAYQDRDNNVITGTPRAVQLGSAYMDDPAAVLMKVAAVVRHPKYKLPKSYYDIALVKMANTVAFSRVIKPACLGIPPATGQPVIATGWGRTEFGGDQSQELRSVSIPIWDMTECYNVLGTSRKLPDGPSSDSQVCAGEKRGGKDTCQGDSGGPAQIQDGCSWRVVAVTSLGRSCGAAHTPALYARVPRAFVSAVVFGSQISNNDNRPQFPQPSGNQQWNSNQQQPNVQQNWNNQRETDNNPQYWNRNQEESTKDPQPSQWSYSTQQSSNSQQWNGNRQNDNQRNRNQQSGQQSTQHYNDNRNINNNRRSNQNSGYYSDQSGQATEYQANNQKQQHDNNYYSQNNGPNSNQYIYNRGQNSNAYTTQRPAYNTPKSGYYNGEVSSDNQSDEGRSYKSDSELWWT